MHDLQGLVDFTPIGSGEVYNNSRTKHYTDGTTNTIVSRTAIFKDKSILTEHMEFEDLRKDSELKSIRSGFEERAAQVWDILERCSLRSYEFTDLADGETEPDFLVKLSSCGMSLEEYDICKSYFNRNEAKEVPADRRNTGIRCSGCNRTLGLLHVSCCRSEVRPYFFYPQELLSLRYD